MPKYVIERELPGAGPVARNFAYRMPTSGSIGGALNDRRSAHSSVISITAASLFKVLNLH